MDKTIKPRCSEVLEHYQCELCTLFATHFYVEIREHRRICNEAQFTALRQSSLNEWKDVCSMPLESYKCNNCAFSTMFRVDLLDHRDNNCKSTVLAEQHQYIEKNGVIMLKEAWKKCHCPHCDFYSHDKDYLRKHILRKHLKRGKCSKRPNGTDRQWFKCKFGAFQTTWKNSLKTHSTTIGHSVQLFKCKMCEYETQTEIRLNRHKSTHAKWFKCEECNHRAKRRRDMKRHVECRHRRQQRLWKCAQCDFTTTTQRYLKKHEKNAHTPEEQIKWHQCQYCDHKAKWRYHLRIHMNCIHAAGDQIKWFPCNQCSYKSKQKEYLKTHKMIQHPPPINEK